MISHNKIRTNLIDFHFVIRSMILDTLDSNMRSCLPLLLRQNSSRQQKKKVKSAKTCIDWIKLKCVKNVLDRWRWCNVNGSYGKNCGKIPSLSSIVFYPFWNFSLSLSVVNLIVHIFILCAMETFLMSLYQKRNYNCSFRTAHEHTQKKIVTERILHARTFYELLNLISLNS